MLMLLSDSHLFKILRKCNCVLEKSQRENVDSYIMFIFQFDKFCAYFFVA